MKVINPEVTMAFSDESAHFDPRFFLSFRNFTKNVLGELEDFKKCLKDQMNSCRTFRRQSVDITCELNLVMFRLESQWIGSECRCNYIWRESRRSSEVSGGCQRLKRKVWCWRLWSWCCRIVHKPARNTILEQEVVLVCWWAQVLPPAAVITEGQKDLN